MKICPLHGVLEGERCPHGIPLCNLRLIKLNHYPIVGWVIWRYPPPEPEKREDQGFEVLPPKE